jgi:hypothetical protein
MRNAIFVPFFCVVLSACGGSSSQPAAGYLAHVSTTQRATDAQVDEILSDPWAYSSKSDEMSGKVTYFADTQSAEHVDFNFPYQGDQTATLALRNNADGSTDVLFFMQKGQIVCDEVENCRVTIKLDDAQPEYYPVSFPNDGSRDAIFFDQTPTDLRQEALTPQNLKKHKMLRVKVTFYQEGDHIFTFDLSRLDLSKLHL